MKILVLGAGGMAGHVIATYLKEQDHAVHTLSAHTALDDDTRLIDVTEQKALKDFLSKTEYDVVINCIALLVNECDLQKDLAVYLNSFIPSLLERIYMQTKTKVIHISSDYVFSGKNPPYKEHDTPDGDSIYSRTKTLGEIDNEKDLTLRLSIIGPTLVKGGKGLFNWLMSSRNSEITGFTNAIWSGVTTIELARGINEAIIQNIAGIYHFAPVETISKFDLLILLKEVFGLQDILINAAEGTSVGTSIVNTRKDFDYVIPNYKKMIEEMKTWMENHPSIYAHYEF